MIERRYEDVNRVAKVLALYALLGESYASSMSAADLREVSNEWWDLISVKAGVNPLSDESLRLLCAIWEYGENH